MRLHPPRPSREQHFVDVIYFTRRLANPSCQIENPYAVCFAPALELAAVYEVLWCKGKLGREIGEDVTETLELIPRQWKVIQHVREKFSCRACEAITQPPAPSHPIARGRAGPKLLAHILFSKYSLHLPLNRQSTTYAREGIDLDVSTLADWVGAAAATLMPLVEVIQAHVFAAERIHADDTRVPVLAKGKTRTGRLWTYVRDDRAFAGRDPPAAVFFYSRDRGSRCRERKNLPSASAPSHHFTLSSSPAPLASWCELSVRGS